MAVALSATHLLRRFALFALTVLFLLTMLRAGYALWYFPVIAETDALVMLFVQGLRFDAALIGLLLLPIVLAGSLLSMFRSTTALARVLIVAWLLLALLFVLLAEFITPALLANNGERPDVAALASLTDLPGYLLGVLRDAPVPAGLGLLVIVLLLIAMFLRLEIGRMLTWPIRKGSAVAFAAIGAIACVLAIFSGVPFVSTPLSEASANISGAPLVNELAMNTGYKLVAEPMATVLNSVPGL